jgi:1-acyl-sn-glycerol-3-phosphate acyltransferase
MKNNSHTYDQSDFLKDTPSPLLYALFSRYVNWYYRFNFHKIRYFMEEPLEKQYSYLFLMNHHSWWDGILPMLIHSNLLAEFNPKGMMDEEQLKRLHYFRKFYVFSVNRANPRKAIASIQYSREHLATPGNILFLYPQGAIFPDDSALFQIESGYQHIVKHNDLVKMIPLFSYIETMKGRKPNLWLRFGSELHPSLNHFNVQNRMISDLITLKKEAHLESDKYTLL